MGLRQSVRDAFSALCGVCIALSASCGTSGIRSADSAVYVRSDTNATTVIAPRAHVGAQLGDSVGLDATYALDSWTGASIDVVTAATHAIHELRHEVNASASWAIKNVSLGGNYRYSTENDYWSNGGVVTADIDMNEKNTSLSIALLGSLDTVGKAKMASFRKPQDSLGARLTLSQVLDTKSVLQLSGEVVRLTGFMASPYRAVGAGGPGLCANADPVTSSMMTCVYEIHPRERLRTAVSLKARRAFGSLVSLGFEYRYYFDDWGLDSHTASPDLSILIGEHGTLSFAYRFYLQSRADFYHAQYLRPVTSYRYLTRDRKLSPMMSNHVGAEYRHDVPMGESGSTVLQLGTRVGLTRFNYSDFIGLKQVDALEVTGSLGLSMH